MIIESKAPTRIDLAGGTIDIWPLYLFHHGAVTINAAINLYATAKLKPRDDKKIIIESKDQGKRVNAASINKLNAAKGGGLIFQSDHSVPGNISGQRYDYVVKLVREHGEYPLELGAYDLADIV